MTTENLEDIVAKLSNLKVTDLAKLKKMLEEKWDVTAAAPVAMAMSAAPAAGQAAAAVIESTDFEVTLAAAPPADKKLSVIKVVREISGLSLPDAKAMVEGAPKVLKASAPKAEAEDIVKKLEAAGAKATLRGL